MWLSTCIPYQLNIVSDYAITQYRTNASEVAHLVRIVCSGLNSPQRIERLGETGPESGQFSNAGYKGQATLCVQSAQYRTRSPEIAFLRTVLVWHSTCIPYQLNIVSDYAITQYWTNASEIAHLVRIVCSGLKPLKSVTTAGRSYSGFSLILSRTRSAFGLARNQYYVNKIVTRNFACPFDGSKCNPDCKLSIAFSTRSRWCETVLAGADYGILVRCGAVLTCGTD